jgi:hypothetical protein
MKYFPVIFLMGSFWSSASATQYSGQPLFSEAFVKISSSSCPTGRKILGKIDLGQVVCDGELRVQVGAFKDLSNAKNFAAKMRSQGIDTLIDPGIDGQLNRVFFSIGGGVSFSEDSSKLIGAKLARDGIKYTVVSGQQTSVATSKPTDFAEKIRLSNSSAKLPQFALSCSFGPSSQNSSNRFVSDGVNIYFGHADGVAWSRSNRVEVTEREFRFQQIAPDGGSYSMNKKTEIRRDSLRVWVTRIDFAGKEDEQVYLCVNIDDQNIINKIKSDFESKKTKFAR